MDVRGHFEFRIKVVNDDYNMIECKPNGTYLKCSRDNTLITEDSTVFAERRSLDEKTGLKEVIIPMGLDEARVYVASFNKVRKSKGWEPLTFDVLNEDV